MARKLISGVGVEIDAFKDCKTIEEIKKSEIFSHLSSKEQENAYNELAQEIGVDLDLG